MSLLRTKFLKLIAALCFFVFTGDLVADAFCDLMGECAAEASQEGGAPCCACAVNSGAAINFADSPLSEVSCTVVCAVQVADESPPARPPEAIEHPPQLS